MNSSLKILFISLFGISASADVKKCTDKGIVSSGKGKEETDSRDVLSETSVKSEEQKVAKPPKKCLYMMFAINVVGPSI